MLSRTPWLGAKIQIKPFRFYPKLTWKAVLCPVLICFSYTLRLLSSPLPRLHSPWYIHCSQAVYCCHRRHGGSQFSRWCIFWGEGGGGIKQDWGKLLKFEGRHFRAINVTWDCSQILSGSYLLGPSARISRSLSLFFPQRWVVML